MEMWSYLIMGMITVPLYDIFFLTIILFVQGKNRGLGEDVQEGKNKINAVRRQTENNKRKSVSPVFTIDTFTILQ